MSNPAFEYCACGSEEALRAMFVPGVKTSGCKDLPRHREPGREVTAASGWAMRGASERNAASSRIEDAAAHPDSGGRKERPEPPAVIPGRARGQLAAARNAIGIKADFDPNPSCRGKLAAELRALERVLGRRGRRRLDSLRSERAVTSPAARAA